MTDGETGQRGDGFELPVMDDVETTDLSDPTSDGGPASAMYGQQIALAVQGLLARRDAIREVQVTASRALTQAIASRPSQIIVDLDHPQNINVEQPTRSPRFSSPEIKFGDFMNGGTRTEKTPALPMSFLGRHLYFANNGVYTPHPTDKKNSEPLYSPVTTPEQLLAAPLSNHPIGATLRVDDGALATAGTPDVHPVFAKLTPYAPGTTALASDRIDLCLPGLVSTHLDLTAKGLYLAGMEKARPLIMSMLLGSETACVELDDVVVCAVKTSGDTQPVSHSCWTVSEPDATTSDRIDLTPDEAAEMLATSAFAAIQRMFDVTKVRVVPQSEVDNVR